MERCAADKMSETWEFKGPMTGIDFFMDCRVRLEDVGKRRAKFWRVEHG